MTGNTPTAIVYGTDMLLPGLEYFSEDLTDDARFTLLGEYRGFNLLLIETARLEKIAAEEEGSIRKAHEYSVGDIVTYRLSHSERKAAVHLSTEISYQPNRSLPHRVLKVLNSGLRLTPLWTYGNVRDVPKTEVRLLSANIPEVLKKQVQQLYPSLRWIPDDDSLPPESTDVAKAGAEYDEKRKKRHRSSVTEVRKGTGGWPS